MHQMVKKQLTFRKTQQYIFQNSLWITYGIAFLSSFWGIWSYPLLDNNEGLYGSIALEMSESPFGYKWVIPHLNGVPYLEKPPLLYWLMALSIKVFGPAEWALRLIPSGATFGTICLITQFARSTEILKRREWVLPLILATSPVWLVQQRMIFFDGLLGVCIAFALTQFFLFYKRDSINHLRKCACGLAFGILAKGFVALVLTGIVILAFLFWERAVLKTFKGCVDPLSVMVFLGVSVPWHIAAAQMNSDFLSYYFINEHLYRFLDVREPRDYYRGPWYYYLGRIPLYLLPWSFMAICSIKSFTWPKESVTRFLWTWFLGFLLFYSASRAKANYYMIVGLAPLAVLMVHNVALKTKTILMVAGYTLVLFMGLIYGVGHTGTLLSQGDVIHSISPQSNLYLFRDYEGISSAGFYWSRPILIIDSNSSDLLYGKKTSNSSLYIPLEDLQKLPKGAYVLVRDFRLQEFQEFSRGLRLRIHYKGINTTLFEFCSP